jgi:hypothetical protein
VLTFILTRVFIFAEKRLNKDRLPPKTLASVGIAAKPAA